MRLLTKSISLAASLALSVTVGQFSPQYASASSPMTATFLSVPSSNIVASSGEAPFDVEFSGGKALTNSTCTALGKDASITLAWSRNGHSLTDRFKNSYSAYENFQEGTYVKTIAITPTGLRCQIGHEVGYRNGSLFFAGWGGDPIVSFNGEESLPFHLAIYSEDGLVGETDGPLYNPWYAPYTPELTGITRGQPVNRYFTFEVTNPPPTDAITSKVILLNGHECLDNDATCEVLMTSANQYLVLIAKGFGNGANLVSIDVQVKYTVKNRSQWTNEVSTANTTLSFVPDASNVPYMDWNSIKLSEKYFLNTEVTCSNKSERPKTKLKCKAKSVVSTTAQSWESLVNTVAPLTIIYQFDNGPWKETTTIVSNPSGTQTNFTFQVPNKTHRRLRIRAVNKEMKMGATTQDTYGSMPSAPRLNNYISLPETILWNSPFTITATPHGGKASICTFYAADQRTVLGKAKVRSGTARATVRTVWSGGVGSRSTVFVYAACKYGTKTYWDYSYTYGYR